MIADLATPDLVTIAMTGLAGPAEEGLLALPVGVGMQVLHTIMDDDVDCRVRSEVVGMAS